MGGLALQASPTLSSSTTSQSCTMNVPTSFPNSTPMSLRSILGQMSHQQIVTIEPDNAKIHDNGMPIQLREGQPRRRRSGIMTQKTAPKSPSCRWDSSAAVMKDSPCSPPPRHRSLGNLAVGIPLRLPHRASSFDESGRKSLTMSLPSISIVE